MNHSEAEEDAHLIKPTKESMVEQLCRLTWLHCSYTEPSNHRVVSSDQFGKFPNGRSRKVEVKLTERMKDG
jgi:hypothetical protein